MPAEAANGRSWKRVERADEERVEERSLPAAVQARLDRKSFWHDPDVLEIANELAEFADAELEEHRSVLVFELYLHQLAEPVQPRDAVVNLKDGEPARPQDASALVDQPLRVGRVLHNPVGVHEVERGVGERELLAVGDLQAGCQALLFEVGTSHVNRRWREVHTRHARAAPGEPRQVHAGAAADFENHSAAPTVKVDEPQQVVKL